MEIFLQSTLGIIGILSLYYGAEFLIKGAVVIAKELKISPLLIGLTLLAFSTSMPELIVSLNAALKGSGDISLGNVVGSNICNIALILGVCAMIIPLRVNKQFFKLDIPIMIFSSVLLMLSFIFFNGVNRIGGIIFFSIMIIYMAINIYTATKKANNNQELEEEKEEENEKPIGLTKAIIFVCLGLGVLILGASLLVDAAIYFARLLEVSEAVIGLTIVAVGTSLPELATSVMAAIHGERDMAIGNVVGSNIFNILSILGITPLISPVISSNINLIDMIAMVVISLIAIIFMASGKVISRIEGAILFISYCLYTTWLIVNI